MNKSKSTTATNQEEKPTCIQVTQDTRKKLAKMGTMDDTFESVILRLMENPDRNNATIDEGENKSE
ncbi:MAG: hypothetical protein FJ356_03855 [Thaumarchaeota archaeon]|nr:hypothetical protein [Nitrososphaerota archaeon]